MDTTVESLLEDAAALGLERWSLTALRSDPTVKVCYLRPPRPSGLPRALYRRVCPVFVGRGRTMVGAVEDALDRAVVKLSGQRFEWRPDILEIARRRRNIARAGKRTPVDGGTYTGR